MKPRNRWEELQLRFAAGEILSAEEETERLELAASDPLALRELEILSELRARMTGTDKALPEALAERVLDGVGARPRLSVVSSSGAPAAAPRTLRPHSAKRALARAAWVALPLVAAGAVLLFRSRPGPEPAQPVAPLPVAAMWTLARSELVLASGVVEVRGAAKVGGGPLAPGDRVSTRAGRACLTVDPGIDVCLGAESALTLESLASTNVRIRVERGTVLAALTQREAGRSFSLEAGDVSATAHGTVFALERAGDGSAVEVVVMEGAVDVANGNTAHERISSHSRATLRSGSGRIERTGVGRGEEARLWALAAQRKLWARPELGVLEIAIAEPGLQASIDEEAPFALPLRAFVPAGRRRITLRWPAGSDASARSVVSEVDVVAGETLTLDPRALKAPSKHMPAASADALLAAARRELGLGNPRAALALYHRLRSAHPASAEAMTVLVTIGKLELDLKQPARALSSFDAYSKGGGPLAQEALAGKIRALRALGRTADEQRAIEQYLEQHPNGFEAPTLEKRLQSLSKSL